MFYFYFVPLIIFLLIALTFISVEWYNGKSVRTSDIALIGISFVPVLNIIFLIIFVAEIAKSDSVVIKGRGK